MNEHNGVVWSLLAQTDFPIKATVTFPDGKRFVFYAKLRLERTVGSYKFGEEIQFNLQTKEITEELRSGRQEWNRLQIALSYSQGLAFLENAIKVLRSKRKDHALFERDSMEEASGSNDDAYSSDYDRGECL